MQSSDEILQGILGGRKKKSLRKSPTRKSPPRKSPKRKVKGGQLASHAQPTTNLSVHGGSYLNEDRPWSAVDALINVPRAAVDVSSMLFSGIVDNRITMKKPQLK